VWNRYEGAKILHWNEPNDGDKYSVIAHNMARPIAWGSTRLAKHNTSELGEMLAAGAEDNEKQRGED
jgi:hypothetical protein